MIVARQNAEGWGKSVVERLSADLQREFPGVSGFSVQNLWYMRQFYQEYQNALKLQPLVGEIGWSHNLVIMGRCKDALDREFYLGMTRKFGWSKNVLIHQIETRVTKNPCWARPTSAGHWSTRLFYSEKADHISNGYFGRQEESSKDPLIMLIWGDGQAEGDDGRHGEIDCGVRG